jgi:hypothetical protein
VPTARSSTESAETWGVCWRRRRTDALQAVRDVAPLVSFRMAAARGRRRVVASSALGLIVLLTVVFAWVPAYLPGADGTPGALRGGMDSHEVALLLPTAYLGVLLISIVSAAAAGGGRELLPREHGVAFPVSPTTDHLGALLMAPLNIAWLLQTWVVLGATAFVVGPERLLVAQVPVLVWLLVATTTSQLVAWSVEWLRRTRHGVWAVRGLVVALVAVMATLIVTDTLVGVLDSSPTVHVLLAAIYGSEGLWLAWLGRVALLLAMAGLALVTGTFVAHDLTRTPVLDEMRAETSTHARRPNPASDLAAMVRTDRAGVWRAVPLRRGFTVLALLPGIVALASALDWYMLNVLPGLVASGGALLFGVNAWCLDGRGSLWRDSLPVSPRVAFVSRVVVLVEVLLLATAIALVLAALRAGVPTAAEVTALLCSAVVVTLQVVSGSMRWSVRRPYAVDMRSARATPAPPLTMVGYSTRLALATTATGMLFVAASRASAWQWPVLLAVPLLAISLLRLSQVARSWEQPEVRSRVITTVAS